MITCLAMAIIAALCGGVVGLMKFGGGCGDFLY